MYTYYLCNDNETVYRISLSLKEEDKKHYLSLLENYVSELVFVEESELKQLVQKEEIKAKNEDEFSKEESQRIVSLSPIFLKRTIVTSTDEIEEYLPLVVTVKTKKYFLLRSFTISMLIKLLSKDLDKIDNPHILKIEKILGNSDYLDFGLILRTFLDEAGNVIPERSYDYHSLMDLLRNLEVEITEKYSRSGLICFWQGDDAEREIANGIATDSKANQQALKKLNLKIYQGES